MFQKGDIVEVVLAHPGTAIHPPLVKSNRHIVNDVITCPKCKTIYLDIGLPKLGNHRGDDCCGLPPNSSDVPQYDSRFFRKIEPLYRTVEISESINKQVKELVFN